MQFPINLNLAGRPVLVVGGGRIAHRKVQQLLACGADVTVLAPHVIEELAQLNVHVLRREYVDGDIAGFRLVITATGDVDVDQRIFDEAEERGIWVNSADDFINPPGVGEPERHVRAMPQARYVLIPESTETRGHSTHTWSIFWEGELKALLARSQ